MAIKQWALSRAEGVNDNKWPRFDSWFSGSIKCIWWLIILTVIVLDAIIGYLLPQLTNQWGVAIIKTVATFELLHPNRKSSLSCSNHIQFLPHEGGFDGCTFSVLEARFYWFLWCCLWKNLNCRTVCPTTGYKRADSQPAHTSTNQPQIFCPVQNFVQILLSFLLVT